jgi:predicted amidohydrolase YtcJ
VKSLRKQGALYKIRNARVLFGPDKLIDISVKDGKISRIERAKLGIYATRRADHDVKGKLALPGLIDCHAHLFEVALQEEMVQLKGSKSIAEMMARIVDYLQMRNQRPTLGGWVLGRGWDQDLFEEGRYPSRKDLDQIISKFPALMVRICGHIALLNTTALKIFSKSRQFSQFGNELIPLLPNGTPGGIVKEAALANCWKKVQGPNLKDLQRMFLLSQKRCLENGLTGVHCILSEDWKKEFACVRELDSRGELLIKLSIFLPIDSLKIVELMSRKSRKRFCKGRKFAVIGFKLYADGSLGARTAALEKDYTDDRGNRGVLNYSDEVVLDYAKRVKEIGMVLASHAIGDKAISQILKAYRKAGVSANDGFRIEHCSVLTNNLLQDVGIATVSVQPMFSKSDYWINERIGSKEERFAYPFKSLSRITNLIAGSDAPVETLNPLSGISAATKNRDASESISLKKSIELYTLNAAKASQLTSDCGEISTGRACDLTILDTTDPDSIENAKVFETIIDGQITNTP